VNSGPKGPDVFATTIGLAEECVSSGAVRAKAHDAGTKSLSEQCRRVDASAAVTLRPGTGRSLSVSSLAGGNTRKAKPFCGYCSIFHAAPQAMTMRTSASAQNVGGVIRRRLRRGGLIQGKRRRSRIDFLMASGMAIMEAVNE
jgi:hypothetical protein